MSRNSLPRPWLFVPRRAGGNRCLRTVRAREVWVHLFDHLFDRLDGSSTCSAARCKEPATIEANIGFGPGLDFDPAHVAIRVPLCDVHAQRAKAEASSVYYGLRWRAYDWLRRLVRKLKRT